MKFYAWGGLILWICLTLATVSTQLHYNLAWPYKSLLQCHLDTVSFAKNFIEDSEFTAEGLLGSSRLIRHLCHFSSRFQSKRGRAKRGACVRRIFVGLIFLHLRQLYCHFLVSQYLCSLCVLSSRSNSLCPARIGLLLHTSRLSVDSKTCTSCLVTYSVVTIGLSPFYIYI